MAKILESMTGRLAELGKIRIGGKGEERPTQAGGKFRLPVKHSYFTITGCERDTAGDLRADDVLMGRLLEKYGIEVVEEKKDAKGVVTKAKVRRLREIPIALLSDKIEEVLSANYCCYEGRSLVGRCDGETCTWFRDSKGVAIPEGRAVPCNGEHEKMVDAKGKQRFKLHTKFVCAIVEGGAVFGGHYILRTTSRITTEQLLGGLKHILALTGGVLAGVPMRLVIRGVEVQPEGKPSTVYVCHVEIRGADLNAVQQQALQMAQVRIKNAKELQTVGQQYRALLAAPGENEDPEEQAEVNDEFQPETAQGSAGAAVPAGPEEDAEVVPPGAPDVAPVIEAQTAQGSKVRVTDAPATGSAPVTGAPVPAQSKAEQARARGRKAAGQPAAAPLAPPKPLVQSAAGPEEPPPPSDVDSIPW